MIYQYFTQSIACVCSLLIHKKFGKLVRQKQLNLFFMRSKNRLWRHFLFFGLISTTSLSYAQVRPTVPERFQELPDPTVDTLSDWSAIEKGLHSSFVTIDKRFPKSVAPNFRPQAIQSVSGWKGERVSVQVLLWTSSPIQGAQVAVTSFKSKDATLPKSIASTHFVRYVMTDEFGPGCGYRKPQDFAASLAPDMLDNLSSFDLEGKKVRPVWVTIDIPRTAKAGVYKADVEVSAKGETMQKLNLEVEVIGQSLPAPQAWSFHLDQWQHPSAVARVLGVPVWSKAHFDAMKPTMKMLADAGQKVITATLNKDPWNVQTYDPYADMITWKKDANGKWSYDYTVFDKWVQFMMDLGITKMINCYSIVPWNNEIHYTDAGQSKVINVVAKPGTPIFEELWTPFLKDFVNHLKQKGWLERTNIAVDERSREEMDGALALIQRVAPELGVSYADNQKTYQRYPNSDDISIAANHPFSQEDLADRKARGLNTSFYICCSDGFPNQFTFSDPAESTYLAWYAEAANFDGLLRWAYNSWVENPVQDSRFRTWPAGDTYIVYPHDRSSIRYERMLEGIQDYEKVQLVKKALLKKGDADNLAKLKEAISKLNTAERKAGWNENLNEAKKLLNDLSRQLVLK